MAAEASVKGVLTKAMLCIRPRRLLALSSLLLSLAQGAAPATAGNARQGGFAGVEYFGSSQLTKLELVKMLGLRVGASPSTIENALMRLKKQLDARHIHAHAEVVTAQPGQLFVVVDVSDSSSDEAPARRLKFPHHIDVSTEKPFLLFADLNSRLDQLQDQGRPAQEAYRDGIKYFSDLPCDEIVEQMIKYAPGMRQELLSLVDNDPNPERRQKAVDLLSWAGGVDDTTLRLIPALDDIDPYVRASVDRYIFPRLSLLSPQFPFGDLAEAFSRQITRPSHEDRAKGLTCLLALCLQHPDLVRPIRQEDEKRIRELSEMSVLPSVKTPAEKLIALFVQDANRAAQPLPPWLR